MNELPEIALTKEEIDRLLHSCNGRAFLVEGAIERVATIAQQRSLEFVFHDYDLDPLTAVPAEQIAVEEFRHQASRERSGAVSKREVMGQAHRECPNSQVAGPHLTMSSRTAS